MKQFAIVNGQKKKNTSQIKPCIHVWFWSSYLQHFIVFSSYLILQFLNYFIRFVAVQIDTLMSYKLSSC